MSTKIKGMHTMKDISKPILFLLLLQPFLYSGFCLCLSNCNHFPISPFILYYHRHKIGYGFDVWHGIRREHSIKSVKQLNLWLLAEYDLSFNIIFLMINVIGTGWNRGHHDGKNTHIDLIHRSLTISLSFFNIYIIN